MLVLLSLAAYAGPTHSAMNNASWQLVTTARHPDAGAVTVSSATIAGIQCFRGSAVTDASPDVMLNVITDIAGSTKWSSAGLSQARLIAHDGPNWVYFQYLDVPNWTMASDRYWFLTSTVQRTAGKIEFDWDPIAPDSPYAAEQQQFAKAHPDAVEPTVNVGSWEFDTAGTQTTVVYQICTQPGGSIPVALQNAATRKTLPDTVGDVVREAKRRAVAASQPGR
jgi:hypothetical protein